MAEDSRIKREQWTIQRERWIIEWRRDQQTIHARGERTGTGYQLDEQAERENNGFSSGSDEKSWELWNAREIWRPVYYLLKEQAIRDDQRTNH